MDQLLFPEALTYVRQVQAKIAGNRRRYDEFVQTLQLFRLQIMDSSTVISTIHTILNDHQTLLDSFMPFIPKNLAAERAEAEDAKVKSCLDFLNRVGTRFNGGKAYRKFLEYCSHAHDHKHKRGEKDTCERVFQLFGENHDLYEEFLRFFPQSRDCGEGLTGQHFTRGTKRSRDDEETFAGDVPPRRPRKEKAAKNVVDEDFEMEDRLCDTDVDIEKLEGCRMRAKYLHHELTVNNLCPANVTLRCYFTPTDLAVIRSLEKRFLEVFGGEKMVHALAELEEVLKKKRENLVRERVEIVQRWNRIRQNR